jgi:divalent metal cation (Fe/Co/Zn/Cd) transporter
VPGERGGLGADLVDLVDSADSALCALTSAAALIGVGLNAGAGWWWADPAAALAIAALAAREGLEAWHSD